jgi:hypothetical protein
LRRKHFPAYAPAFIASKQIKQLDTFDQNFSESRKPYVVDAAIAWLMASEILIRGDGVAACCSARLLGLNHLPFAVARAGRPKLPTIVISESTQSLLRDIFDGKELFQTSTRIRKRIVCWGSKADAMTLPHSAAVMSEQSLLDQLWPRVPNCTCEEMGAPRWTILTSSAEGRLPKALDFGSRIASTVSVGLRSHAEPEACWMESLETGWLFLLALGSGNGSLISVGDAPGRLLERSRLIAPEIDGLTGPVSEFPAYPRILPTLCGPGWLACGTAAVAFDPLCGEGAANAAREAMLASAAVKAMLGGFDMGGVLAHYSGRLVGGFLRHLELCRHFYLRGGGGRFWRAEVDLLERGIKWARDRLRGNPRFRYRLIGFELEQLHPESPAP